MRTSNIFVCNDNQQAFILKLYCIARPASQYHSISITLGAFISRYNLNILLNGEGAECTADGLALISDQQLADTHTFIDHVKPHGKAGSSINVSLTAWHTVFSMEKS